MAGRKLIVIGTGKGSQGPPGSPGGGGTPAPSVTATGSITSYQQEANATQPVFSGVITLPVSDPNYSHLKFITVEAVSPSDPITGTVRVIPLDNCVFNAPFPGGTIAYSGTGASILQTDTAQPGWGLKVTPLNDYYEPGMPTLIPSDYPTHSLTIVGVTITQLSATDDTIDRWQDSGGATHAVVPVTISCTNYPQIVSICYVSPQYGRIWQGWFPIPAAATVINLGAEVGTALMNTAQPTTIYPPTGGDETVTIYAAVGTWGGDTDPTTVPGVVSTTVLVSAPPAPAETDATGAYIDVIRTGNNGIVNTWWWDNLYTTLPYGDPNFKAARWTVQGGALVGGKFTPNGLEVPFTDDDGSIVFRPFGTNSNIVSIVLPTSGPWTIPSKFNADGSLNVNSAFCFRNYVESPLDANGPGTGTWTQQHDWSSLGVSTPGTNAEMYVVFDLDTQGVINGANVTDNTLPAAALVESTLGDALNVVNKTLTLTVGAALSTINNTLNVNVGGALAKINDSISLQVGPALTDLGGVLALKLGSILGVVGDILTVLDGQIGPTQISTVNAAQVNDLTLTVQNIVGGMNITVAAGNVTNLTSTVQYIVGGMNITVAAGNVTNLTSAVQYIVGSMNITVAAGNVIGIFNLNIGNFSGNIVLNQIPDLLISDSKIGSLSASKITAGTITVSSTNAGLFVKYLANGFQTSIFPASLVQLYADGSTQGVVLSCLGGTDAVLSLQSTYHNNGVSSIQITTYTPGIFINGVQVLSTRVATAPVTLADVIAVLRHHGLSQ